MLLGYEDIVEVLDKRATALSNGANWTPEKERDFNELVGWAARATAEQLEAFSDDLIGGTYPRQRRLWRDITG